MSGFGALAELPWERVTDKIERRVLAGQQGMIVWWKMKAGRPRGCSSASSRADRLDAQGQNGLPHRER
jgi:hypothetical protein